MDINGSDDAVHGWRFGKLGSSLNTMLNGRYSAGKTYD